MLLLPSWPGRLTSLSPVFTPAGPWPAIASQVEGQGDSPGWLPSRTQLGFLPPCQPPALPSCGFSVDVLLLNQPLLKDTLVPVASQEEPSLRSLQPMVKGLPAPVASPVLGVRSQQVWEGTLIYPLTLPVLRRLYLGAPLMRASGQVTTSGSFRFLICVMELRITQL